jgi:antitoxin component YwqK of YwqJK toxin-antitoxin module
MKLNTYDGYDQEGNYVNDKKEGLFKSYWQNEKLRKLDTYKNGQKINRRSYNKIGELEFDQDYPYVEKK